MAPKYKQVATQIESDIVNHVYQHTNKLLTEDEYATKYGVSRNTVLREPHPLYADHGRGCRASRRGGSCGHAGVDRNRNET